MLGWSPGVAGAIKIERWRGPAALYRAGPLHDNGGKRAKEESAHGRDFISVPYFSAMKPLEDNENHRRRHASHGVEVSRGRIRWIF
jgi:hypothetical protein